MQDLTRVLPVHLVAEFAWCLVSQCCVRQRKWYLKLIHHSTGQGQLPPASVVVKILRCRADP
ncbi:hypothetical protein E2C01_023840 [Portunus trituberculatus]|uniref:Uncharacterized protein n=1 Tax=Portunus trituberculatus TaxID=210409 RepID=A0A5B7EC83_PORTR|nr:hypothetical protein [Portunus trituberculatus]